MLSLTAALVALMASSSASFFCFHLGFRRGAHANEGAASRKLGKALAQLFLVVVARPLIDAENLF